MKTPRYIRKEYDVVVIGAGHAGIEAAFATSRLGYETLLTTISMESVADLPCNPNIGGTGKGHLVREIDALGGEMALVIDETYLQSRMLNTSKGPAIHSLRVQADKSAYHREMKKRLEREPRLTLREAEAVDIEVKDGKVQGVLMRTGLFVPCRAVIVATGTYLNGRILMGELRYEGGPHGTMPAKFLSVGLKKLGIPLRRFKTGTPARVHRNSVDTSSMEIQPGDAEFVPFSFLNFDHPPIREQMPCYLTYTTPLTKQIIEENLHRSPLYAGDEAVGTGPRYCPSIEDKIVKFPDREIHQVFLEPEGEDTCEMYVQGVSSSLPEEVQQKLYESIEGLKNVEIMRTAYGIEYDCIDPLILHPTLEHQEISGLYFAGQINGSSGYEEAAAQGLIAGINAARKMSDKDPFVLDRADAYIGVLIDDLVTKGTNEPYRMMTARAEYRLALRQDNADFRLTERGYATGLVTTERLETMQKRKQQLEAEIKRLQKVVVHPTEAVNEHLTALSSTPLSQPTHLAQLFKRPEISYENARVLDPERPELPIDIRRQAEIELKYEGYVKKQQQQIEQFKKLETKKVDHIEDFGVIRGLSREAIDKLNLVKPHTVGQASRISGVSPADINVLLIALEVERRTRRDG